MIELMEVPKAIFAQVGPTSDVDKLMNAFFVNTRGYIEFKIKNALEFNFEIKSADFAYSSMGVNSNDRITYMAFKERYIVAGMLETRTAFNNLQFTFFRDLSCLEKDVL